MLCGGFHYQTQVDAGYGERVKCIAALNKTGGGAEEEEEEEGWWGTARQRTV